MQSPRVGSAAPRTVSDATTGSLPNVVVIGAMKAATSALHRYLDHHPEASMSAPKELNFFFDATGSDDGPLPPRTTPVNREGWTRQGNWFRGLAWYRRHFPPGVSVRGESSPGYTSPDHPQVPARMAAVVPDATLVYLVRDPVERALSQYRHHRREGTERRPLEQALLDPDSQYVSRGRYAERLAPFRARFPRERIVVVVQEELRNDRRTTLGRLFARLGLDDHFWTDELDREWHTGGGTRPVLPRRTLARLGEAFADDVAVLQDFLGRELPWPLGAGREPARR